MRRTRIVCTLGPASATPAVLRRLVAAGMDVARLNFSHGDETEHRAAVAAVRTAAQAAHRHVALLQDLQGPKIRTGRLVQPVVRLTRGHRLVMTSKPVLGDAARIPVSHPAIIRALRQNDRLLLSDGQIELRVLGAGDEELPCVVVRGGLLGERKGIAVPMRDFGLPAVTEKDEADIRLGAELGFDYLAVSFVRDADDVADLRAVLDRIGWRVPVVVKLEKVEALHNLRRILALSDAVMVARGDLGVEMPLGEVPASQKDIIWNANRLGKPVITATEMLESMVSSNRPTRAEASDVANAIWDGTDAVMLSQETSIGAHPVEAVRAMSRICVAAERHPSYRRHRPLWVDHGSVGGAIAHSACEVARAVGARAIIAFTESGATALRVSKAYPSVPVIAASPHPESLRRTALFSSVIPLQVDHSVDADDMIAKAGAAAVANGLVRRCDRVVLVAGIPPGQTGQTNTLKVAEV